MQLNQTQPSPLTVLLQLNFCYQVQTTVVSPDAHPSSYSSVATTLYPTLVVLRGRWCNIIVLNAHAPSEEKSDEEKDSFYEELEQVF